MRFKRISEITLTLINGVWAVPFLVMARIFRPFLLVRFGKFFFERIGHFAADVGQRKAESLVETSKRTLDFWYLPRNHECPNIYWAQITRRWFNVHSCVRHLVAWNKLLPFGKAHILNSSDNGSLDLDGFLERAKLSLPSTPEERVEAQAWMTKFGWKPGDAFICLLVRDSKYLSQYLPGTDWSYHSYRNSDIQTYVKAIDYLTSRGVFVFRMGKDMADEANYSHPKFIDYAFRSDRTDFLDIWLFANCSFCISTGSGLDAISAVFRRPILFLNFSPLQALWSWSNTVYYPKILKWRNSGRFLTMKEYLDHSYHHTSNYIDAGIEILDLTDQQILDAVKEFSSCQLDLSSSKSHSKISRERYLKILISHPAFEKNHGFIHSEMAIASSFLQHVGESFFQ